MPRIVSTDDSPRAFPPDFVWGVSTSAYQIEGGVAADGRAPSIWDTFSHAPGRVANGDTGDVACDHYHRWADDLDLIRALGVGAYRFSVSWSRWMPAGRGRVNRAGASFYDRLVDGALERGVEPWPCLYHWDLPQALQDEGGWAARDVVEWFGDYAASVMEVLGDRVRHVAVMNEPNATALLGHLLGVHAPGTSDIVAYAAVAHHLNLATGHAAARLRSEHADVRIGTILNLQPVVAHGDGDDDRAAADLLDAAWNGNHLEPLVAGRYPAAMEAIVGGAVCDGDMERVRQPLDWLGVNCYSQVRVAADPSSVIGLRLVDPPAGVETTAMGWEVAPEALSRQLIATKARLGDVPIFVTENGAAYDDRPGPALEVDDARRTRYLERHVREVWAARAAGVDVRGYFVWSLLDNFEWHEGYAKRFGLVYVDFATQRRVPKRSYRWYRRLVRDGVVPPWDDGA
jgi:beta-glucosidase